jgi:acetate kinase
MDDGGCGTRLSGELSHYMWSGGPAPEENASRMTSVDHVSDCAMDDDGRLTLSVNAGSSSLKISLFENIELVLTCSVSSISAPPAAVSFSASECSIKDQRADSVKDHESAFALFLDLLKRHASIDKQRISHVCHRVVHGGDYPDPVIISNQSYHHIEELSNLAPLYIRRIS